MAPMTSSKDVSCMAVFHSLKKRFAIFKLCSAELLKGGVKCEPACVGAYNVSFK